LIGRRYLVEKKEEGNPNGFASVNQLGQNDPVGKKGSYATSSCNKAKNINAPKRKNCALAQEGKTSKKM
jgi:hypothetical protein